MLILMGGVIGGAFAGWAYTANVKIYRFDLSTINKILAHMMCGMVAIMLWWFVASWV